MKNRTIKSVILILVTLVVILMMTACQNSDGFTSSVTALQLKEPQYTIVKTTAKPDWNKVPVLAVDKVLWTPDAGIRAKGQICHDSENIYVHLMAKEKDIRAVNKEPLSAVYEDSCLEFFFMREGADDYFNFEVNPNGVLNIQFGPTKTDRTDLVREDAKDYFAIHTDRTAEGWEVFYRIPLKFIQVFYPNFSFEEPITANVYKCGNKTVHKHYLAWNTVHSETPNFHRPVDFAKMVFEQ